MSVYLRLEWKSSLPRLHSSVCLIAPFGTLEEEIESAASDWWSGVIKVHLIGFNAERGRGFLLFGNCIINEMFLVSIASWFVMVGRHVYTQWIFLSALKGCFRHQAAFSPMSSFRISLRICFYHHRIGGFLKVSFVCDEWRGRSSSLQGISISFSLSEMC